MALNGVNCVQYYQNIMRAKSQVFSNS